MKSTVLLGHLFCVLLAFGVASGSAAQAEAQVTPAASVSFKHDNGHLGGKLLLALGFLSLVAAGAFVLVRLKKDGRLRLLPGVLDEYEGCRVLEIKRIGARLTVVTVRTPGGAIVTIAENGHSICVVNRLEAGTAISAGASRET